MSWKIGPLLIAIASVAVRLVGNHALADVLAMGYLASVTSHLMRSGELRSAVRATRS
jgi:hypothetical protein